MRSFKMLCVIGVLCGELLLSGCGNVYLQGEALTAAETSAMDAYQAAQRAAQPPSAGSSESQPAAAPQWAKAYLEENFKQWRSFVRSARKDLNWGPKLQTERD